MRKALNKKGITLIEIIIVIALIAVLGTAIGNIIVAPMRANVRNQQINHASQVAHALGNFIREELIFASKVYVGEVNSELYVIRNNAANNRIIFEPPGGSDFGVSFFAQVQADSDFVSFRVFREDGHTDVLRIEITVRVQDGAPSYTSSFTVWFVNFDMLNEVVRPPEVGGAEYYEIISYKRQ